jgi:alpha-L-fucosidase
VKDDIKADPFMAVDLEFGIDLSVKFSQPEKCKVNNDSWMENFGEWKHLYQIGDWKAGSSTTWECEVKTPGLYLIELTYSGNGPKVWRVETGENNRIQNRQNSCSIRQTQPIGWIRFEKAGRQTLTVSMPEGGEAQTNLSAIKITPVEFY